MVGKPDKPLRRYYVSMTWEEESRLGGYTTVLWATSYWEAEEKCRDEMASVRVQGHEESGDGSGEDDLSDTAWWLQNYGGQWKLIDCFEVDAFIAMHSGKGVHA